MKSTLNYIFIILFGVALAAMTLVLKFIEYRHFVGSLSSEFYIGTVALIFTCMGIWVGKYLLKSNINNENFDHKHQLALKDTYKLNTREFEILQLLSEGLSNKEIANTLFIALPTVKTHTSNLYSKLNVNNRTQAVIMVQNYTEKDVSY